MCPVCLVAIVVADATSGVRCGPLNELPRGEWHGTRSGGSKA